ncbi:MAG: carboxypeptidase regulatory-like domain-containing protein [Candidatus Acidiferrales bacterium]
MKMWKVMFLAVVLAGSLLVVTGANAQTFDRGEIHGIVYDTSHSVVPKAKLTLSNFSTGYKRENTSDVNGSYAFPQILPGIYQIKAEAAGFAAISITDITVNIGASLDLDITLPVKGQTATVTVSASSAGPVDTTTAGINQIINQRNVEGLPLSGRDYRDLAQLSPSAEVVPGLRGGIRLGGQISDYSGLVIDGQDSFNNFFGENFASLETKNFTVPLDSVQEFQVVTNGFAPEFGRATGGLINVVTKSGTNEWHGTAHYNYRGSGLTADDYLGNSSNIDRQQQWGGTFGFPIHKNTQFLFLAADFQREHGPLVSSFCNPGTNPITGGTQADCEAALATATGPVFNAPMAGTVVPPGCTSNTGSILQACYGVSNLAQLEGASNQFQNLNTVLGHWDWQMTPANHFSIRGYGSRNHTSGFTGGRGQNEIQDAFGNTENFINQGISGVFALNTVMGRKVNEIRVSIQGETRKRHPNQPGVPELIISGADGNGFSITAGQRFFLPINNDNGKFQAQDNFEVTWGKHDIKFGGDVNPFVDRKDLFAGWSAGSYSFGSLADFNTDPTAAFFIQGFSVNPGVPFAQAGTLRPAYQTGMGLYWQDKWSVTPRFTVTYGLRWDGTWNPQPQTPFGGNTVPVGNNRAALNFRSVPQQIPNDFGQWGPRLGFAWNIGSTEHPTVVRGAWGLYYAQSPTIFFPQGGGGKTTTDFGTEPMNGFPYLFTDISQLPASSGPPSFTYVDPKFKNPRVSNLTVGVEHTLVRDLTVSGTFAYVHSWRLRTGGFNEEAWARNFDVVGTDAQGRALLAGTPGMGANAGDISVSNGADALGSFGRGNYYSFVANVTKRFSNHFQVFANYTWSQNKDNASSERDTDTFFGPQDPLNLALDYGRNSLDVTHQFKAAGVYDLPMGFQVSSIVIAHSGTPYPVYINMDINGDGVSNSGHNNDRPTVLVGGKTVLLGRYPLSQPNYANWDARIMKDFGFAERYHVQLQADFFNVTNRANKFSNPEATATIDYSGNCVNQSAGIAGFSCTPLARKPRAGDLSTGGTLLAPNQISPLSNPFAFQAGVKFIF